VIGMDVGLEETCQLSLCALVGRFAYKTRSSTTFKDWMHSHWFSILGYLPKHWTLNFGWFGLVFNSPEDVELILSSFWAFEGGNIMLKRWCTGFDPATEYFSLRHIWVLLPGLPLNLWNKPALRAIGNLLGRFLKVDEKCLSSQDKRMARVLVEIDIHAGLMESLELEWRGQIMIQRLDYLGIPFRCSHCRQTGHLRNDCTYRSGFGRSEDHLDAFTLYYLYE
jgi:hypothetical protein